MLQNWCLVDLPPRLRHIRHLQDPCLYKSTKRPDFICPSSWIYDSFSRRWHNTYVQNLNDFAIYDWLKSFPFLGFALENVISISHFDLIPIE